MISSYCGYNSCYNCLDRNDEFSINNKYYINENKQDTEEEKMNDDLGTDRDIKIETIDTFIVNNEYDE
eukprot:UN04283